MSPGYEEDDQENCSLSCLKSCGRNGRDGGHTDTDTSPFSMFLLFELTKSQRLTEEIQG